MSVTNGERITFKRLRPNPLFHDWLEELYDETKLKGSKLEPVLKEALSSIKKYPLPLQSGAECAILRGFNKQLCLFLDKRLEVHRSSNTECVVYESSLGSCSKTSDSEDEGCLKFNNVAKILQESAKNYVKTIPCSALAKRVTPRYTFRSGTYAILMALVDLNKKQSMKKDELMVAAQKYCDEDMSLVWKNMTRLIAKGIIKKTGTNKPQFSLTEQGFTVAKDLFRHIQSKHGVDEVVMNDVLTNYDTYDEPNNCNSEVNSVNCVKSKLNDIETILNNNDMPINGITRVTTDNYADSDIIEHCAIVIEDQVTIDEFVLITMDPGSFDIILLIDKNETSGLSKKNDPTVTQFTKYPDLKHEYRSLKVGDFTWIARHKINTDQELVLPYVIERKRMDDLAASIKDGRFHEQKFRLRRCGLNHVIYMIENHGNNKHVGLPMQSLMQALANTRVQEGFKVHITDSLRHSARFLAMMTLRLQYEYKDRRLQGHNGEPKDDIHMTFGHFNKSSIKNKALSVTDTFIKLLLQLKGVSVEKALTITNVYKTPRLLIQAYETCDQKDGEMLLANLRFGEMNRSIGPSRRGLYSPSVSPSRILTNLTRRFKSTLGWNQLSQVYKTIKTTMLIGSAQVLLQIKNKEIQDIQLIKSCNMRLFYVRI